MQTDGAGDYELWVSCCRSASRKVKLLPRTDSSFREMPRLEAQFAYWELREISAAT
jgi:hypothetical protein